MAELVPLRSEGLELDLAPQHGMTITRVSLVGDPRNILWTRPGARPRDLTGAELGPSGSASIATFDRDLLLGGWFVMFPTAGLPGSRDDLWMHGEAARLAWRLDAVSDVSVTGSLRTPATGFDLTREVLLDGDTVRVRTQAVNHSGEVRRVTFGEHPCFDRARFAGGRIEAHPASATVPDLADPACAALSGERIIGWPDAPARVGGMVDLSHLPAEPDGRHDHVSLRGIRSAAILGPDLRVDLAWSAALPDALLWQHFRPATSPWAGDVFALEPTTSPGRTADHAERAGALTEVPPGGEVEFEVSMTVRAVG